MDGSRFDQLARVLARPHSRRTVITALAGGVLGSIGAQFGPLAALAQTATPPPRSIRHRSYPATISRAGT